MVTLNAASLTSLLKDTVTATVAEIVIDAACNRITAHRYKIRPLDGTAGSKSRNVTQEELGWIQTVAIAIYASEYKTSGASASSASLGIGAFSTSTSSSQSNSSFTGGNDPDALAEQAATILREIAQSDWSRAII